MKRISEKEYSRLFSQLRMFLSSGLPLLKALELINSALFNRAIEELKQGSSFSQALFLADKNIPIVIVNMVKVAEHNGTLEDACKRLAQYFAQRSKYREKIKAALIYPCFVLGLSFLMLFGLFVFVLPTFNSLFADLGVALPGFTLAMIYLSGKLPLFLLLLAIIVAASFWLLRRSEKGLLFLDEIKLVFTKKLLLARVAQTLGSLLSSGLAILPALEIALQNINNRVLQKGLLGIKEKVETGISLSEAMQRSRLFPEQMVQMVYVGENSGNLDQILLQTAEHYEEEVFYTLKRSVSLLEPLSTLLVGLFVGFIALSVILPLINLINTLQ